jgi:hypothetical protein
MLLQLEKMSKYRSKPSCILGLGLSTSTLLIADVARSQSKDSKEDSLPSESTAADANRQIQKANPLQSSGSNSTSIGTGNNGSASYTFVMSTPALIAIAVVVGGLALFPVVSLLLNSRKAAKLGKESFLAKFSNRFRKPQVLESDKFLHQRNFEKLAQITNQAENLNADKFGNTEFMVFFKIKSYIARSIDEYANLDDVIEMLGVAIDAQNSFSKIDSTESRYCSSSQQELYKFVNGLLSKDLDPTVFKDQIDRKLQEVLPLLKTEEGKVALEAYISEVSKISTNPLGVKLLLLFKKYQLDDYSTLRSVANTITQLESEDLLNLDSLLLLVMVKYDVFEKLGPIVGIEDKYNRPETYGKMLQYIGLKSRHETSYQKFQEFLLLLKQWEIHYKSIVNIRDKYSAKDYGLPKEFGAQLPGFGIYQKYKDSFNLISSATPLSIAPSQTETPEAEVLVPVAVTEKDVNSMLLQRYFSNELTSEIEILDERETQGSTTNTSRLSKN